MNFYEFISGPSKELIIKYAVGIYSVLFFLLILYVIRCRQKMRCDMKNKRIINIDYKKVYNILYRNKMKKYELISYDKICFAFSYNYNIKFFTHF